MCVYVEAGGDISIGNQPIQLTQTHTHTPLNRIPSAQHLSGNNNHNNMIPMGTCVFVCMCATALGSGSGAAQINISVAGNNNNIY